MAGGTSRSSAAVRPRNSGGLVAMVVKELRQAVLSGTFEAGEKLPSEAQLTARFRVSRTVIREAVAALRADRLVEARQGAGVFVLEHAARLSLPFQIIDRERISGIIEMLELRAAIEIEAVALAAKRRSPAQDEAIHEAHLKLLDLARTGNSTTQADFAFHLAIANATNNNRFEELLTIMGQSVIPRGALELSNDGFGAEQYLLYIDDEHRMIAEAISAGDEVAGREAMRLHLKGSQQRYRDLIRSAII